MKFFEKLEERLETKKLLFQEKLWIDKAIVALGVIVLTIYIVSNVYFIIKGN